MTGLERRRGFGWPGLLAAALCGHEDIGTRRLCGHGDADGLCASPPGAMVGSMRSKHRSGCDAPGCAAAPEGEAAREIERHEARALAALRARDGAACLRERTAINASLPSSCVSIGRVESATGHEAASATASAIRIVRTTDVRASHADSAAPSMADGVHRRILTLVRRPTPPALQPCFFSRAARI